MYSSRPEEAKARQTSHLQNLLYLMPCRPEHGCGNADTPGPRRRRATFAVTQSLRVYSKTSACVQPLSGQGILISEGHHSCFMILSSYWEYWR